MKHPPRVPRKKVIEPPEGWAVYVLECGDGSLYTGSSNDVGRRLATHASGKGARYTRSRLPVKLVFAEPVEDRSAALKREAALKKLSRSEKLALIGRRAKRVTAGGRRTR